MGDFLAKMTGGELIWLVVILGMTIYYVTHTIARQWRLVRQTEIEASLKAEMVKQGKSLEEMAQVLQLSPTSVKDEDESEEEEEAKQKEEDFLVKTLEDMLDQDRSAEEIARVLQAYQPGADVPFPIQEERKAALKRAILRKMVDHERPGEDIERVLQVCQTTTTNYRQN
jgi:hypothetical protein